jgi:hypothetical protein
LGFSTVAAMPISAKLLLMISSEVW